MEAIESPLEEIGTQPNRQTARMREFNMEAGRVSAKRAERGTPGATDAAKSENVNVGFEAFTDSQQQFLGQIRPLYSLTY